MTEKRLITFEQLDYFMLHDVSAEEFWDTLPEAPPASDSLDALEDDMSTEMLARVCAGDAEQAAETCPYCNQTDGHKMSCERDGRNHKERIARMKAAATPRPVGSAPYGYCPICGAKGKSRERRPDGNDKCEKGHTYRSVDAVPMKEPEAQPCDHDNCDWIELAFHFKCPRCGAFIDKEPELTGKEPPAQPLRDCPTCKHKDESGRDSNSKCWDCGAERHNWEPPAQPWRLKLVDEVNDLKRQRCLLGQKLEAKDAELAERDAMLLSYWNGWITAKKEQAELVALLRQLEWSDMYTGEYRCHLCGAPRDGLVSKQHAADCKLAAALARQDCSETTERTEP